MTIIVAIPENETGLHTLHAAVGEAKRWETDLVVVNLGLSPLELAEVDVDGVPLLVVDRMGRGDRDPCETVLREIAERAASRLVIGIRRRTPVGKALLGSVTQRLILDSPIPVLAVKLPGATD